MYELAAGNLHKMRTSLAPSIDYQLLLNNQEVLLNQFLGKQLYLEYQGIIHCIQCGRKTTKSFQQGYCFPCMRRLGECNFCIIHPEKCRCEEEPCPDDDWAHAHCKQPHVVYIANSTGLKVGITRDSQVPTRWMDQGARQALPILQTANRYQAGIIEVCLKQFVNDRTDWRKLLRADAEGINLIVARNNLLTQAQTAIQEAIAPFKAGDISFFADIEPIEISYPILSYPHKVQALSLDKTARIGGFLQGIKGQYLLFDTGVINMRKFAGYSIKLYSDIPQESIHPVSIEKVL